MGTIFESPNTIAYSQECEKTELALEIERKIRQNGLTHQQTAVILGIDDEQLSNIFRLKLAGFSAETLLNFCDTLGKGRFTVPNRKDSLHEP
ncbi:MAG: XRE family transcriptional regulator [Verrucomicrobia bacterium]|nr:XRE family transcriptional regulator [Verrucomicrobiota bacterium]